MPPAEMARRIPPIASLAAFEAVARHRSFSKAAEELCLTESAVSHRIRVLERHLSVQLFYRTNRHVALVPAAELFLNNVRDILGRLQNAAAALRGDHRSLLRVSILPSLASAWLVKRIGRFTEQHPEIDLDIQASLAVANVLGGEADIGIRCGTKVEKGLVGHRLFSDQLFPVASPGYLARSHPIRTPKDLKDAVLLRHRRLPWKPWFGEAGLPWGEPVVGPLFSDAALLIQGAINGQGVALTRHSLAVDELAAGRLLRVTNVSLKCETDFHVVHAPDSEHRTEVSTFVQWILEQAGSGPDVREPVEHSVATAMIS